jgi:N-terminal domain of reverse transcriptase
MTTAQTVGAISSEAAEWFAIDWQAVYRNVRRLQARIVKAVKENRWNKVKALQRLLTHSYSGKVLAVRRVTENTGKKTPGVDRVIWETPEDKTKAVRDLKRREYQPQPLRRVYIPKKSDRNNIKSAYHGEHALRTLKELARSYLAISKDLTRVMNRLKALYHSWGIPCAGKEVYAPRHRAEWLAKISEAGVRRRAEHYYQQLDVLRPLRQEVRRDLLQEAKKHKAWKLLRQIPGIGANPGSHHDRLALETHDSAQYSVAEGQLERSKKPAAVRGLNKDYNHDLKDIFKGAVTRVSNSRGPLRDFYDNLLNKGRKPTMARLTLARKIAAIILIVWKKEVRFDANYLKPQAA